MVDTIKTLLRSKANYWEVLRIVNDVLEQDEAGQKKEVERLYGVLEGMGEYDILAWLKGLKAGVQLELQEIIGIGDMLQELQELHREGKIRCLIVSIQDDDGYMQSMYAGKINPLEAAGMAMLTTQQLCCDIFCPVSGE